MNAPYLNMGVLRGRKHRVVWEIRGNVGFLVEVEDRGPNVAAFVAVKKMRTSGPNAQPEKSAVLNDYAFEIKGDNDVDLLQKAYDLLKQKKVTSDEIFTKLGTL